MKNILLYSVSLVFAIFCLAGCVPDGSPEIGPEPTQPSQVEVAINLGVASHGENLQSRADYNDPYMNVGECMKNWLVVIVDGNRQVVDVVKNEPYQEGETERSTDSFWEKLTPGSTYTFYSFANISESELGMGAYPKGSTLPNDYFENKNFSVSIPSLVYADHWTDFESDYFPHGIPMSSKQVVTIAEDTKNINLEVIRMLAKIELQLTNQTNHTITFKGLTLSDITPNTSDNLKLLPGNDSTDENGTIHVNAPNIATDKKEQVAYTQKQESGEQQNYTISSRGSLQICFYINESQATGANKYFVLQLQTNDNDNTPTQVNRRLAMLDWNKICRNDYRVIPIKLDDYAIDWEVEAFTPIGVLPEVEDDGDNLTVHFGYYGEFHMIPKVRQLSLGYYAELLDGQFKYLEGDKNIFDAMPTWNKNKRVEGEMANKSGSALYALQLTARKEGSTEAIVLTRKVRFVMDAVNLSRSSTASSPHECKWQKIKLIQ